MTRQELKSKRERMGLNIGQMAGLIKTPRGTYVMDHYLIGIYIRPEGEDQRLFTLYYSKGVGHEGTPPEITEVLNCLQLDAAMLDQASDFEDWAARLGYDPDSRAAERIYSGCIEQTDRLRDFLGDDLFNDFLMLEEED